MKKVFITALIAISALTSCDPIGAAGKAVEAVEVKNTAVQCSSVTNLQPNLDSLNQVKKEIQIAQALQDSLLQDSLKTEQLSAITLIKYYTSSPNSAGGVDFNIIWKNLSPKTVKYASFKVDAYNAVNDVVYSKYGDGRTRVKCTGPIKQGKIDGYGTYWDCVWYNYSIDYARIVDIYIMYTDGSTLTIEKENIKELGYYREDNKF